jgi:transglutaminase-like putative cysteine protease
LGLGLAAGILALVSWSGARAADLPDWAARAAAQPTPAWAGGARALRLYDEELITVPRAGRIRTVTRGAVRVLSLSGKEEASCSPAYRRGTSEVHDLRAWVVDAKGRVKKLDSHDAVDRSLAGEYTLYSEVREEELSAPDPAVGTVFAWEYVTEEESLLAQWPWFFQIDVPSLLSRVSLTLPEGLEPAVVRFAADSLTATQSGRTWTWEMRDLRPVPDELLAPNAWSAHAAIVLGVKGAGPRSAAGVSFADWPEVARWVDELAAPQAHVTPEIAARAAALTTGARDTLARLQALAHAVQELNYVAILLGLGHGGGIRPHAAADVLRLGYGDCKDKANLLCTLLAAGGHEAWLIFVHAGGRARVDERWPSPDQFNHCIVVMRVPRGTKLPAVFEHPGLGTLLAFDPTAPLTAFGDLPQAEQGSLGLLVAPRTGGLVRLPAVPPEANRLERRIDAELDADGNLTAWLRERSVGQQAVEERRLRHALSLSDYQRDLESWLAAGSTSVNLHEFSTDEDTLAGRFRLEAEYDVPRFARIVQGELIFRAALVTRRLALALPDSARSLPIELTGTCFAETVTVRLPQGYAVDEMPEARHVQRDFARLDADWSVDGGALRFTWLWTLQSLTLPPERYREVREMLAANLAASQSPVVLIRR